VRIAAVIPTYDRAAMCEAAVRSVLAQTRPADETVVVDDGSRDDTEARLAPYAGDGRIRYVKQANAGAADARNRGVREASAEWVAFLDSDDRWLPRKLEAQAAFLAAHPRVALVASSYMKDEAGDLFERERHGRTGRVFLDLFIANWVRTSTVVMRRDLFLEIGGFQQKFSPCEDYDLWLKVARDHEVGYLAEPLATYTHHPGGISRAALKSRKLFIHILEENDDPALVPRAVYRRRMAYLCTRVAKHCLREGLREEAREYFRRAVRTHRLYVPGWLGLIRSTLGK